MAKKYKYVLPEPSAGGAFIVGFTALMTIMLAFFILLNTLSIRDQSKVKEALGSLRGSFGLFEGGRGLQEEGSGWATSLSQTAMEDEEKKAGGAERFSSVEDLVKKKLPNEISSKNGPDAYLLTINSSAYFTKGGWSLSPTLFPFLDNVASVIKEMETPIIIEGHTDESGGESVYNWYISVNRAATVLRYLEGSGVPKYLLTAEGRAGYHPNVPNDSEYNRKKNRRVDIIFKKNYQNETPPKDLEHKISEDGIENSEPSAQ